MKWLCPSAVPGTAVVSPKVSPAGTGQGVPGQAGQACSSLGHWSCPCPWMSSEDLSNPWARKQNPQNLSQQPKCQCQGARSCPSSVPRAGTPGLWHSSEQGSTGSATAQLHLLLPHTQGQQKIPQELLVRECTRSISNISLCEHKPSPVQLGNKSPPHSFGDLQHTVWF